MTRLILLPSGQCLNLDLVHTLEMDSDERPIYTRDGTRLPRAFVVNGDREGDVYPIIYAQDADALRAWLRANAERADAPEGPECEDARALRIGRAVLDAFGFSGSPAYEVETLIGAVRHIVQGPRLDALYALREALEERGEEG